MFRAIGLDKHIYREVPDLKYWRKFQYCSQINGEVYNETDFFSGREADLLKELSDMTPAHLPTYKLVKILADSLPPQVDVRLNSEVVGLQQGNSGVKLTFSSGETYEADYVLACDGVRSVLRTLSGIGMTGSPYSRQNVGVHFYSKQLGELAAENPAMLYFVFNSSTVNIIVMHNPQEGEFVLHLPFFPAAPPQFTSDYFKQIILKSVAAPLSDVRIKEILPWTLASGLATQLSKGRVFLVGDAGHRFPPSGGFGLNNGLSDAFNLCWKFNAPELLDTYSTERLPRLQQTLQASLYNYDTVSRISKAFGLSADLAEKIVLSVGQCDLAKPLVPSLLEYGLKLIDVPSGKHYLQTSTRLIGLNYPQLDLHYKFSEGAFTSSGGFLLPHFPVYRGDSSVSSRSIAVESDGFGFTQIGDTKMPCRYPVRHISTNLQKTWLVRPDNIVYSSS
jgi:2-polyprenyl-6-methoxyphenol hydroxylase-like FAD-dependent oxidoreductase